MAAGVRQRGVMVTCDEVVHVSVVTGIPGYSLSPRAPMCAPAGHLQQWISHEYLPDCGLIRGKPSVYAGYRGRWSSIIRLQAVLVSISSRWSPVFMHIKALLVSRVPSGFFLGCCPDPGSEIFPGSRVPVCQKKEKFAEPSPFVTLLAGRLGYHG